MLDILVRINKLTLIVLSFCLLFALNACGTTKSPPEKVLKDAISTQISIAREPISMASKSDSDFNPKIKNIEVKETKEIYTNSLSLTNITGEVEWKISNKSNLMRQNFDIYVAKDIELDVWLLVKNYESNSSASKDLIVFPLIKE